MNSLSWLLYLIYFLGALKVALCIFAAIATAGFIASLAWFAIVTDDYNWNRREKKEKEELLARPRKLRNSSFWFAIPLILFIAVVPNQQTVKLIAASEVSYYIMQTDAGKQVINQMTDAAGKTGDIVNDSLELLHQYVKTELTETVKQQIDETTKNSESTK